MVVRAEIKDRETVTEPIWDEMFKAAKAVQNSRKISDYVEAGGVAAAVLRESVIKKVLAIMPDGKQGPPCGACRELMVQIMPDDYQEIEILLDYETKRIVTLGEITPEWWI